MDSDIQIPSDCYKADDSVGNVSELSQMLQVERFWGLDELPSALMDFCYRLHEHEWKEEERTGYPALVDMLHIFMHETPLIEAMTCGSRSEIFLFMVGVSSPDDVAATRAAASLGRLDYLIILRERGYQWDNGTCNAAAEGGHLDCLKYAKDNNCPWNPSTDGKLHLMEWAAENGFKLCPYVCENAAKNGHLHCLQYAFNNGCPWSEEVTYGAARNGHVDCLRFALENDCPVGSHTCMNAACSGHLECLMLLHQYNASWDERATRFAAAYGHLQCLQYLHENGCPWDSTASSGAVVSGCVNCLRYTISHGCVYEEHILSTTLTRRSLPCLEYLIGDLGLYMNEDGSLFVQALQLCSFPCLKYLIDMGCPMGDLSPHQEPRSNDPARDEQLLLCLEYATRHGWCWNDVLVDFLCKSEEEFPTCWAFVTDNDCYMTS